MMDSSESFEKVKDRLDEIVEAVSDENISLDDALKLYEEAVQLGLAASNLLEENLAENNAAFDEEQNGNTTSSEDSSEPTVDRAEENTEISEESGPANQGKNEDEPSREQARED